MATLSPHIKSNGYVVSMGGQRLRCRYERAIAVLSP